MQQLIPSHKSSQDSQLQFDCQLHNILHTSTVRIILYYRGKTALGNGSEINMSKLCTYHILNFIDTKLFLSKDKLYIAEISHIFKMLLD